MERSREEKYFRKMFLWILKPPSDNIETPLNILTDPIQLL